MKSYTGHSPYQRPRRDLLIVSLIRTDGKRKGNVYVWPVEPVDHGPVHTVGFGGRRGVIAGSSYNVVPFALLIFLEHYFYYKGKEW